MAVELPLVLYPATNVMSGMANTLPPTITKYQAVGVNNLLIRGTIESTLYSIDAQQMANVIWTGPATPAGGTGSFTFTQTTSTTITTPIGGPYYPSNCGSEPIYSPAVMRRRHRDVYPRRELPPIEVQREIVRERVRKASARARAMSLLLDHLSDEQQDSYRRQRHFLVQGGKTKRMYRIRDNGNPGGNVDVLSVDGRVEMRLCAHANTNEIPHPDQLLAQKLMLELDEEEFLRIANRHAA